MRVAFAIFAIAALGALIAFAATRDPPARDEHAGHGPKATAPASPPPSAPPAPREREAAPRELAAVPAPPPTHAGHEPAAPAGVSETDAARESAARGVREEPRAPIDVLPEQQMRIGLATKPAVRRPVRHAIRAIGSVVADERREAQVHTRVAGFIDEISVSEIGAEVKRGQVLYRLYAPELVATQQELVSARKETELGRRITEAALERLALWNVAPSEIEALKSGAQPKRALAFLSPVSGFVINKMAVKGAYVTPEMELYRIADLSKVWVIVSLYENELPLVSVRDRAEVHLAGAGGEVVSGVVSYVYPDVDTVTRTGRARIEIDNKRLSLKPGMFANVAIEKDLGEAVVIPEDAIIFTGQRNLVFKKTSATRFVPVEVTTGPRVESGRVVLTGIGAGDEVVVRASFLIDAESRLQAALEIGGAPQGHAGHGG
jgi:membrane fusion protein, copper/silver efflux system